MKLENYPKKKKYFYLFLFVLPFFIYWNSINNEYAIDDNIVVEGVAKVQEGIAGIPEIFTSHYSTDSEQNYGYRPMVSTSFAIEKQFFKQLPASQSVQEKAHNDKLTQANISHLINILIYALTGVMIFYFLNLLFTDEHYLLPFIIAFIFIILPIHTEPVNNLKSRDELMMLFGVVASLVFYVKFALRGKLGYLLLAMLIFCFAMLSKKSAIAIVGLVPVTLYFLKTDYKKIAIALVSVLAVFAVLIFSKNHLLTEASVRNLSHFENPLFTEGTFANRIAMGFYCAFFYLKMLIYPKEFSFYYGYSYIPLVNWSYYEVWLGMLIFIPLAVYGIIQWWRRDKLGLGIAFWLGTMLGIINILTPVVGIVADRFAYIISLGFSIVVGVLLVRVFSLKVSKKDNSISVSNILIGFLAIMGVLYATKILTRNPDWENYIVLYSSDIPHLSQSAKANVMLADRLSVKMTNEENVEKKVHLLKQVKGYYEQAVKIEPTYSSALNNLAFLNLQYTHNYEDALSYLILAEPQNPIGVMRNMAFAYYKTGRYEKAIDYFIKSIENFPEDDYLYENLLELAQNEKYKIEIEQRLLKVYKNVGASSLVFNIKLGQYYYNEGDYEEALTYCKRALKINPENEQLSNFVQQLSNQLGE